MSQVSVSCKYVHPAKIVCLKKAVCCSIKLKLCHLRKSLTAVPSVLKLIRSMYFMKILE